MLRFRRAPANWQPRFLLSSATIAASTFFLSAIAHAGPTITSVTATDQTTALYADFINEPSDPPNVIPGLPGTEWNDNNWSELSSPIVNGKSGIAAKSTGSKTSDTSFNATHNFVKRARAGSTAINLRLWTTPKFTATANVTATGGWIAKITVEAGSQLYKHNNKTQVSASDVTTTVTGGTVVAGQNGNLLIAADNTSNGSYKAVTGNKTFTVRGVGNAALQVTMSQQFKLRMAAGDSAWVWDPGNSGSGCIFGGMALSETLNDINCSAPSAGVAAPFGFKVSGTILADTDSDGIADVDDNCPNINNVDQKDTDGDGIGDVCDATPTGDDDGDGIDNSIDNCPAIANPNQADWNFNGIGDACDDSDGDGINDDVDNCRSQANPDQADLDGDGVGDACDPDIDGDGIMNHVDNCPRVSNTNQADWNNNGIGDACEDTDGDGINDDQDLCPQDPLNNCLANPGGDFDGDGHNNGTDNCPTTANPDQADLDGNGIGDACDDTDGDGYDDNHDNCPLVANPDQADWNQNGIGDACDDSDGDGIPDSQDPCRDDKDNNCPANPGGDFDGDGHNNGSDNCPLIANPDQADWNSNGVGDACEDSDGDGVNDDADVCPADKDDNCVENPNGDFDGDGHNNGSDNCPLIANPDQADWNNNGIGDACEDSDGDGVNDDKDVCPADRDDNCVENPDADTDGDGEYNGDDNCPLHANPDQKDTDGDGIGDACDPVTDGDDGQDADPGVLMRSWGELPKDIFGSSLAAGDVNGDGYIDVVVGAYKWSKPQPGTVKRLRAVGRVYIFSGKTGLLIRTHEGEAKDDWFGHAVAVADVDGDGAADIIVGAPKADANRTLKDTGKLYVYSGKTGELLASQYGLVRGEQLGARLASLTGAAGSYIAAAAPRAKVFNVAQAGYVDVIRYDAANQALVAVNRLQGQARAERLGEVMAPFTDLSGDGYPELAIGLPKLANGGKVKAGIVRIYRTDADSVAALLHTIDGAKIPAARNGDLFGSSIAAVADMDGDNVPELLIGAPGFDAMIAGKKAANSGAAFVVASRSLGAELAVLSSYYGEAKGDQLGWAVADGQHVSPEMNYHFVSARGADTRIKHPSKLKQIKAKDAGAVYGWRVGEQQWSMRRYGKAPKAYYGNMLVNAGDFNGDGYSDVISASAFMSRVSSINSKWVRNTGFVEVYSGEMIATEPR